MIKEAGIFVISAAFLVYFISPVKEEQSPSPNQSETKQEVAPSTNQASDYWGGEEYGDDVAEQEFVFGEPMVTTDPISETDYSVNGDGGDEQSDQREHASSAVVSSNSPSSRTTKPRPIHSSSPKPGELGSAENPIPLN